MVDHDLRAARDTLAGSPCAASRAPPCNGALRDSNGNRREPVTEPRSSAFGSAIEPAFWGSYGSDDSCATAACEPRPTGHWVASCGSGVRRAPAPERRFGAPPLAERLGCACSREARSTGDSRMAETALDRVISDAQLRTSRLGRPRTGGTARSTHFVAVDGAVRDVVQGRVRVGRVSTRSSVNNARWPVDRLGEVQPDHGSVATGGVLRLASHRAIPRIVRCTARSAANSPGPTDVGYTLKAFLSRDVRDLLVVGRPGQPGSVCPRAAPAISTTVVWRLAFRDACRRAAGAIARGSRALGPPHR